MEHYNVIVGAFFAREMFQQCSSSTRFPCNNALKMNFPDRGLDLMFLRIRSICGALDLMFHKCSSGFEAFVKH